MVLCYFSAFKFLTLDAKDKATSINYESKYFLNVQHLKVSFINKQVQVSIAPWLPQVWVPPLYETRRDPCGRLYQVEVRRGFWDTIQEQGYWEQRQTRVWQPQRVEDGPAPPDALLPRRGPRQSFF